ncbi:MAG: hypothetical protein ACKVP3_14385 [Hyphomicrobiaceae bacterium]
MLRLAAFDDVRFYQHGAHAIPILQLAQSIEHVLRLGDDALDRWTPGDVIARISKEHH